MNNKKVLSKERPELLKEWDFEKNASICMPDEITIGSGKIVWWKCDRGHSFKQSISKRVNRNSKCPYCQGKKVLVGFNDLLTTNPEIAKEWDYEKNKHLMPTEVSKGSHKKVWWKCRECGNSYQAQVYNKTLNNNCPYCSNRKVVVGLNDLKTLYPDVASDWNYEKNVLKPEDVIYSSKDKVWWKCQECGYEWKAEIRSRTKQNTGCPSCAGNVLVEGKNDLITLYPEIAKEWDYEKNRDLLPNKITAHNGKKVWWKCNRGHSWQAVVSSRTSGTGCPICSASQKSSLPEQTILYYLSKMFVVESRCKIAKQEIDIYLPDYKVGIEYDGLRYHTGKEAKIKEDRKNMILSNHGITLFRVKESKNRDEIENKTVYYISNGSYINLDIAIKNLFHIISNHIGINIDIKVDFKKDRDEISRNYERSINNSSIVNTNPEIAKEWDYEKNGLLIPEMFSIGSGEKIWWLCDKGHSYKASILSRKKGDGCPYCSNHKVLTGFNDLETTNPELIAEWDYEKNKISPSQITYGSGNKVWWKCKKCGHEWQATISSRSLGNGCPNCSKYKRWDSRKRNISEEKLFIKQFPDLLKEWDYEKNDSIDLDTVSCGSRINAWWRCKKCGYEWQASVANRTGSNKTGCPYCNHKVVWVGHNDLATTNPELIAEWDYEKNESLNPTDVSKGSHKKVWWKCKKCGHEWQARVSSRSIGNKCPKCRKKKSI